MLIMWKKLELEEYNRRNFIKNKQNKNVKITG